MIRKLRNSRGFTLVELMIVVAIIGILAALAIFGVKKYVTNSKTAEARNAIGQISKDGATAWSREIMAASVMDDAAVRASANVLCGASDPVPGTVPKGEKYQSSTAVQTDYNKGDYQNGWVCLHFSVEGPQYFQYQYTNADALHFAAVAKGDLDGDGVPSTFTRFAEVRNAQVVLAPTIEEINPEE